MELNRNEAGWTNKRGDQVDIEEDYLYPLVKSSDLNNAFPVGSRAVIVTQKYIGQETAGLSQRAPRLWAYLMDHADYFEVRKSSIYQRQPPFSIFGVGDYSFAPYKVIVAGLYKRP